MIRTLATLSALLLSTSAIAAQAEMDHGGGHGEDHQMHEASSDHGGHDADHGDGAHEHDSAEDHGDHEQATDNEAEEEKTAAAPMTMTPEIETALEAGGEPVVVDVLGVVCDFCAKAMNKTIGKREEVSAIYVDLDTKALNLVIKPDMTLDDETLRKLVKKAGYKTAAIRRGEAALEGVSDAPDPS